MQQLETFEVEGSHILSKDDALESRSEKVVIRWVRLIKDCQDFNFGELNINPCHTCVHNLSDLRLSKMYHLFRVSSLTLDRRSLDFDANNCFLISMFGGEHLHEPFSGCVYLVVEVHIGP